MNTEQNHKTFKTKSLTGIPAPTPCSVFSVAYVGKGLLFMEEIWKDAHGYEGYYEISNLGRIRRLPKRVFCRGWKTRLAKGGIVKIRLNSNGYYTASLSKNSKPKHQRVHRLMALAFIPNPLNKKEVNHKDGNKLNNDLSNLEWTTKSENGLHAYKTGLNHSALGAANSLSKAISQFDLDGNKLADFGSIREASRITGIHHNTIGQNLYGDSIVCMKKFKFKYA